MEIYSRFLFSDRQFKRNPPRITITAFEVTDGKMSVYETDLLRDEEIWAIARPLNPSRNLKGRAELEGDHFTSQGLSIDEDVPPPYHYNIEGWGSEPEQLSKFQELIGKAKLVLL